MEHVICDRVCQHLQSVKFSPSEASRYASLISKWIEKSGPEWTVERLKSLKQAFMDRIQSEHGKYVVPLGWATRKNSKGEVIFADGLVHRVLSSDLSNLKQIEAFLRIYQVITLDTVTKSQKRKMVKAIEGSPSYDQGAVNMVCSSINTRDISVSSMNKIMDIGENSDRLLHMLGNTTKRSPTFSIDSSITYLRSENRGNVAVADWMEYFQADKATNDLWKKHNDRVSTALCVSNENFSYRAKPTKGEGLVGSLAIIQSPGAKARWIANPLLAFQAIGEPLKNKLFAYSKIAYPEIATHDQEGGHATVVQWLKEGRNVHSFDATAFTDRFPLSIQIAVLHNLKMKGIVNDFDIDFFKHVVTGKWHSHNLKRDIKWSVGQPLGYGPSFHIATLTHACLLDVLVKRVTSGRSMWRIVGDDIVIADDNLAQAYERTMTQIGVEINRSKSIVSAKYAEFLGKLISKEGVNPSIKVKLLTNSDQIVSSLAFYGWNGYKHLSRSERALATQAFMPTYLGGTGLKIPGVRRSVWLKMTNQKLWAEQLVKKELSQFFGRTSDFPDLQSVLALYSEYYDRNGLPLSPTEWSLVSDSVISEFTGQPLRLTRGRINDHTDFTDTNNYLFLSDLLSRQSLAGRNHIFLPLGGVNRDNPATSILNEQGYIDNTEKECSLSISLPKTTMEDPYGKPKEDRSQSSRPYFKRWAKHLIINKAGDCEELARELNNQTEEEGPPEESASFKP